MIECLVIRECRYLRGIRSWVSVEWAWPCYWKCVIGWGWALKFQKPCQVQWQSFLPKSVDPDGEVSASPPSCQHICCHAPCHEENGLNLWSCKQAPIKYFLLEELPWSCCLFTQTEHCLDILGTCCSKRSSEQHFPISESRAICLSQIVI